MKEVWSLENRKVGRVEHAYHLRTQLAGVGGGGGRGHPQLQQDGPNQLRLHDTLLKKKKEKEKEDRRGNGPVGKDSSSWITTERRYSRHRERQAGSERHRPERSGELGSVGCPQPFENGAAMV